MVRSCTGLLLLLALDWPGPAAVALKIASTV
jgi:hypothetical protein